MIPGGAVWSNSASQRTAVLRAADTMKKADLEKQLGKKIAGRMQQEPHSDRYGTASGGIADKREQRERDKAAGLVPFAVKLPQDLVAKLQAIAAERGVTLNDLTTELLQGTLAPAPSTKSKKAKSKEG